MQCESPATAGLSSFSSLSKRLRHANPQITWSRDAIAHVRLGTSPSCCMRESVSSSPHAEEIRSPAKRKK
jgi:hypothetical protein